MRIHGVGGVLLFASEPDLLCSWYGRLLGVTFARPPGTRRFEARVGPAEGGLRILIEAAPEPLAEGPRDAALLLLVDDLDALLRRLEHRGIDVEATEDGEGARRAWIRDPEGRRVALQHAPVAAKAEEPGADAGAGAGADAGAGAGAGADAGAGAGADADAGADAGADADAGAAADAGADAGTDTEAKADTDTDTATETKADTDTDTDTAAKTDTDTDTDTDAAAKTDTDAEEEPPAPPARPEHVGAPAPIIVSVRPDKLSAQTGGVLRVLGANFAEGCRVRFGGAAWDARRLDSGLLEIDAPARAPGPCTIDIENPDGQRVAGAILYEPGPTIARLVPAEGPPRGGTEVLVEGSGFQRGCVLSFHGARSPEVRFESATRLWFVTPPHEEGALRGEVRVTNPDGLAAVAPEPFAYRLGTPRIHGLSVDRGYIGGGKRLTVTGEDLERGCAGRIGGRTAATTWRGAQTVDLIVPPADRVGTVDVEIENPDGQVATAPASFTYELPPAPPKLIEVRPDRGFLAGGQELHLLGDNFDEATVVRIGEVRVQVELISRNEIRVVTPPRAESGVVAIELVDGAGVAVRREDGFTYDERPAPRISGVSPRTGPMVGGTRVVIEGEYFPASASVRIGKQAPRRAVIRSAAQIEIVTPPSREAGYVDVEVISPEAGVAVAKSAFRYDASPPPVIESVAPNRGRVDGGTELSITGKGFMAETAVLVGGKPAGRVKVVNATTIDVITPPGTDGQMVDIVVRNPDGKESVSRRAFQYDARYRG